MIRIGSRASLLALEQADIFRKALQGNGVSSQVVAIDSDGDLHAHRPVVEFGGKGVFVRRLDRVLLDGGVDVCIHSLKDVEARMPDGIALVSVIEAADRFDVLVLAPHLAMDLGGVDSSDIGSVFSVLPPGARVATSSPRRRAMLLSLRADLDVVPVRGNVHSRLNRLASCEDGNTPPFDALVLASCGLQRLGKVGAFLPLDPMVFTPAGGQGIIAAVVRKDDQDTRRCFAGIGEGRSLLVAHAEQAFIESLGANCHTPVGVWGRWLPDEERANFLRLRAALFSFDGDRCHRVVMESLVTSVDQARSLGRSAAREMREHADGALLSSLHLAATCDPVG